MTRAETFKLQRLLNNRGFGPIEEDGRYGPLTAAAYERMLKLSDAGGSGNSIPVPAPAKPWWTSRALIGSVVTVALSVLGAFVDWKVDAESLTDVIYQIILAISGLLAFIGTVRRQAPIDPTLVVPGVRVGAGRVRPSERLPTDAHQASDDQRNQSPFIDP